MRLWRWWRGEGPPRDEMAVRAVEESHRRLAELRQQRDRVEAARDRLAEMVEQALRGQ